MTSAICRIHRQGDMTARTPPHTPLGWKGDRHDSASSPSGIPATAGLPSKMPPEMAHAPTRITSLGSGMAAKVSRRALSMFRVTGPVTTIPPIPRWVWVCRHRKAL